MRRTFCCIKYPSYAIRNHKFHDGRFTTEDPEVIRLIEGANGYGDFIHPAETVEELAAMKEKEEKAAARRVPRYDEAFSPPEALRQAVAAHDEFMEQRESPLYPLDKPSEEEKKNEEETGTPEEEEDEKEEAPPIAHQGARGTHTGRGQRKGQFIDPKEK